MGKYPIDISDEENAKLKYPFLPCDQYDEIIHHPGGGTFLIRYSKEPLSREAVERMVAINERAAARRILAERKEKAGE